MFTNNVSIKLFADDIKIYIEIRDPSQAVDFQDSINSIASWALKWQLKFSINKCHHMQITLRNSCSPSVYLLDGVILPTVSSKLYWFRRLHG